MEVDANAYDFDACLRWCLAGVVPRDCPSAWDLQRPSGEKYHVCGDNFSCDGADFHFSTTALLVQGSFSSSRPPHPSLTPLYTAV